MIMIPTQRPVVENLNSQYVDLPRLTEHCQGEFGSSCIRLRVPRTEGVIYFDNDATPSSVFESKHEQLEGQYVLYWLVEAMNEHNSTRLCFFRRTCPPVCGGFRRRMLRCPALARGASLGTMGSELW
jgi:hypothetical protein